jgi:hypothetical protein
MSGIGNLKASVGSEVCGSIDHKAHMGPASTEKAACHGPRCLAASAMAVVPPWAR